MDVHTPHWVTLTIGVVIDWRFLFVCIASARQLRER